MTIGEALEQGLFKLTRDTWADPYAVMHIKFTPHGKLSPVLKSGTMSGRKRRIGMFKDIDNRHTLNDWVPWVDPDAECNLT